MNKTYHVISDNELAFLRRLTERLSCKLSASDVRDIQKTLGESILPAINERGELDADKLVEVLT